MRYELKCGKLTVTDNEWEYGETFVCLDDRFGDVDICEYTVKEAIENGYDLGIDFDDIDMDTIDKYGDRMIAATEDIYGDNKYLIANSNLWFNEEFQSKWNGDSRTEFAFCCLSLVIIEPEKFTLSLLQSLNANNTESEAA
jgi:hypothetical protein